MGSDVITFRTLLPPNDPLIRSSLLVVGTTWSGSIAFCNGVYTDPGVIVTAAHCILDDHDYFVFIPVRVRESRSDPFSEIDLRAVRVEGGKRHPQYYYSFSDGVIKNDIGYLPLSFKGESLLKPVAMLSDTSRVAPAASVAWESGKEKSFFKVKGGNQVSIVGYKVERDEIIKGVYLIRDATSFVGPINPYQSLLIALDPGTTIHKGVSGSGIFYKHKGTYFLAGVTSHFFPGVHLLSAASVSSYKSWLQKQVRSTSKN